MYLVRRKTYEHPRTSWWLIWRSPISSCCSRWHRRLLSTASTRPGTLARLCVKFTRCLDPYSAVLPFGQWQWLPLIDMLWLWKDYRRSPWQTLRRFWKFCSFGCSLHFGPFCQWWGGIDTCQRETWLLAELTTYRRTGGVDHTSWFTHFSSTSYR